MAKATTRSTPSGRRCAREGTPAQRRTRLVVASASLAALVLTALVYWLWAARSPEAVLRNALRAIDRKDAATLMRLCEPEEARRLALTEAKVAAVVNDIFWKEGAPALSGAAVQRVTGTPADLAVFAVCPTGRDSRAAKRPAFFVGINDSQANGWRLGLTWLFYSYLKDAGADEAAGRLRYVAVCRAHGVPGLMDYSPAFHDLDEMEAIARARAGNTR